MIFLQYCNFLVQIVLVTNRLRATQDESRSDIVLVHDTSSLHHLPTTIVFIILGDLNIFHSSLHHNLTDTRDTQVDIIYLLHTICLIHCYKLLLK